VRKEEEFEYFFLSPFTSQCRMQNAIRSNSMSRYVLCYLNVCLSVFCLLVFFPSPSMGFIIQVNIFIHGTVCSLA